MIRKLCMSLCLAGFTLVLAPPAFATSTYASAVAATPSLVSFWRLGESGTQAQANGMTMADATGANPGTYYNGVAPSQPGSLEGDPGTSVAFGNPDGYATVPYSASLNTPTFTFEAWVKFTYSTEWQVLGGNGAQLGAQYGYLVQTIDDSGKPSLGLVLGNGGGYNAETSVKGVDVVPGQWYYVAASYDGTTARVYIDGTLKGSQTTPYVQNTSAPLQLGVNPVYGGSTGEMLGSMDDIAYYNAPLSGSTIAQHYSLGISDGVAPQTTILSGPSGTTSSTSASLTFTSNSVDPTYQCQLDGGPWQACASPLQLTGLSSGPHTVAARGVNRAGQIDPSPPSASWIVDTSTPSSWFTSGPASVTADTSAGFTFGGSAGATYTCQLDAASPAACSSPYTLTGLDDGAHTLAITATSASGVVQPAGTDYNWVVDTAPPSSVFVMQGPTAGQPTLAFGFAANKSPVTFLCKIDAGGWNSCATPFTGFPASAGPHSVEVAAVDALGQVGPSVVYAWAVNPPAPASPLASAPPSLPRLSLSVTFPRQVGSGTAPVTTPRCAKPKSCVTHKRRRASRLSWKTTYAATVTFSILTTSGRTLARKSVSSGHTSGWFAIPKGVLSKLRARHKYVAVLQASGGGVRSNTVRVIFSVVSR